jgi:hypothetical protein
MAAAVFLFLLLSNAVLGWEKEEHLLLADRAFACVLADLDVKLRHPLIFNSGSGFSIELDKKLSQGRTFGEISAMASIPDISFSRFQERNKTILQQLQSLPASLFDKVWNEHGRRDLLSAALSNKNVIVNYLLNHVLSLRLAKQAAEEKVNGKEAFRRALIYEAFALSYLADAFSSGHLLVPLSDWLRDLHPVNNKDAHNFYCNEGAFVLDSQGNAWQTFGDGLLNWYAPTYNHVLEACITSLREVFLVYYVSIPDGIVPGKLKKWGESVSNGASLEELAKKWTSRQSGQDYYSFTRMTALLLIPMTISAAWSVRTKEIDKHCIHQRKCYPQFREQGYFDPGLEEIDKKFLYSHKHVPDWMIPDFLPNERPEDLVKLNPDCASVRYTQTRNFPPSFKGLLFHTGGGMAFRINGNNPVGMIGLGYGLINDLIFFNNFSLDINMMPGFGKHHRLLLLPTVGFGLLLPRPLNLWKAYRFEIGYTWSLRSQGKDSGLNLAGGIEFPPIPLGFTYAGLTIRLMYRKFFMERSRHSVALELVFH